MFVKLVMVVRRRRPTTGPLHDRGWEEARAGQSCPLELGNEQGAPCLAEATRAITTSVAAALPHLLQRPLALSGRSKVSGAEEYGSLLRKRSRGTGRARHVSLCYSHLASFQRARALLRRRDCCASMQL